MKKLILIPILFIGCCVNSQNKLLSKEDIHYFKIVVVDSIQKPLITMG